MSFTLSLAVLLLLSYLIGSIPFGYLIGRCHGLDIRKEGSGNIGATNVTRVIGPWWGKLCFLLDFLKGLLPAGSAVLLTGNGVLEDPYHLLPAAATILYAFHLPGATHSLPSVLLFILLGILAILKHLSNIKRLLNGTENRFNKRG